MLPNKNIGELISENSGAKTELSNFLSLHMPKRAAELWCEKYFKSKPLNKLTEKEIEVISENLHNWEVIPSGTEGFGKAEVTKGGVDTEELSSKTMESKKINGLFFIGEALDVTGWLGGYNFQWAWASGFAAGQYV